ncbi:MAG: DNA polymerase III subunit alpha [Pirellulaceae bacterium]|nr:DNA polymerase III subunit alpha [Pirellulaceae bacterium]
MTDTPSFVHLHCHSHYSLLDGASSIPRLVNKAKEYGMNALALTDHGNLHGALQHYRACKEVGINPIIGYEAYIAPGSRFDKGGGTMKDSSYHLTLLAKNKTGFRNLVKMASYAALEGFYFKPRIDKELLEKYNEGIICLSGCVSSEFNRKLLTGAASEEKLGAAIETAKWFRKVFGDRYFLEIMNNGVDIQKLALEGTVEVSKRIGIPLVATSDCHYVEKGDADAQDILLCINTGKFRTDANRMKMHGHEFYLRSQSEMYAKFSGNEEAVALSQKIADSVDIELDLGQRHFPSFEVPPEKTPDQYLRELCEQGLRERYADIPEMYANGQFSEAVVQRLDRELGVISKLGFSNYFLIVWEFVDYARKCEIPATARGSGVGALVCFALYLSHVCPIKYDLLFERFLDENRLEAPDIDIDFCKIGRGDVIRYVKEKYGEENVAQIGTFGTLAARAAIKDVGRVLSIPLVRVNQITDMVPDDLGISIDGAIKKSTELRDEYERDGEVRELLDFAMKIEGLARNVGTHAAAVVIADKPLTDYVPLGRVPGKTDIITQWSMNDVEAAGLLKMDFLGLRNLTILRSAVELIKQTTGEKIDPLKFPLDDEKTFALLCRGETKGIFQLESGGIRDLLQKMKPDHFLDIVATNALYRPGPLEGGMVDDYIDVKHGRKQAEYKHPVLKEILEETNGVMVYQEQVMRILNHLGDIELASAYTCIKAISKKKVETINANREQFLKGATGKGLKLKEAEDFWNMIEKFAGYGFNKSHSTAYALIAYQTAYLKAHYPVEYMAALLTGDIPGRNFKRKDALVEHMEDCERMGIEVVPPSVNTSHVEFSVANGKIHFGMAAIKGCGGSAAEAIVKARDEEGPFKSLFDFCERVDPSECNRAAIETLVKAGAFDCFQAKRSQLLEIVERAVSAGAKSIADRRRGQQSLFGGEAEEEQGELDTASLPDLEEIPHREKLLMEKEVLGFYINGHPLAEFSDSFRTYCSHSTAAIVDVETKREVILGGMISSIKTAHVRKVRKGSTHTKFANFDLEDAQGSIRCIMWPEDFAKLGHLVEPDAVVVIRGTIDRRGGDEANLICNEVIPVSQLEQHYTSGIRIHLAEARTTPETIVQLKRILQSFAGDRKVEFTLTLKSGDRVHLASEEIRAEVTPELKDRISSLLGEGNYQVVTTPPQV